MPRIHIFNPSHEMALAADSYQYTPPKHIKAMEADLAMMPLLWADAGDVALSPSMIEEKGGWHRFIQQFDDKEPLELSVWGWNKALRNRLIHFGCPVSMLPTEKELDEWREMASREFAVKYAEQFYDEWQNGNVLVQNRMSFCHNENDLNDWIRQNGYPFVTKTPYSSSGRGLHIIQTESDDVSKLGQNYLVDKFYDKQLDFAMEFRVGEESVDYLGLSVFKASKEGKYGCNYVKSQSALQEMLTREGLSVSDFDDLRNSHLHILEKLFVDHNKGIMDHNRDIVGHNGDIEDHNVGIVDHNGDIVGHNGDIVGSCRGIDDHCGGIDDHYGGNGGSYRGIVGIDMMMVKEGGKMLVHPCVELNLRMNMGVVAMKLYEKGIEKLDAPDNPDVHFFPRVEDSTFSIEYRQ